MIHFNANWFNNGKWLSEQRQSEKQKDSKTGLEYKVSWAW